MVKIKQIIPQKDSQNLRCLVSREADLVLIVHSSS